MFGVARCLNPPIRSFLLNRYIFCPVVYLIFPTWQPLTRTLSTLQTCKLESIVIFCSNEGLIKPVCFHSHGRLLWLNLQFKLTSLMNCNKSKHGSWLYCLRLWLLYKSSYVTSLPQYRVFVVLIGRKEKHIVELVLGISFFFQFS